MPNGTCPHHEWVERTMQDVKATCVAERRGLWEELGKLRESRTAEYRMAIAQLIGIVGVLIAVLVKG